MQRALKPGGYLLVTADNNARLNRILIRDRLPVSTAAPGREAFRSCAGYGLRLQGFNRSGTIRVSSIASSATAVSRT